MVPFNPKKKKFSFSFTFSASKHFSLSLSCSLSFSLECFQCQFSSCKQNEAVSFGFSGGFVHEESFFLLRITNVVERNRSELAIGDLVSALSERLREGDRKPKTKTTTTTTTTTNTTIHHNLLLRLLLQRSDSNLSPLVLRRCCFSLTTTLSLPFPSTSSIDANTSSTKLSAEIWHWRSKPKKTNTRIRE